MKITLEINEKQANTILKALDLYSRLQSGQISELSCPFSSPFKEKILESNSSIEKEIKNIKKKLFPELSLNESYGIFSKEIPEEAKIAYDILQVVRNKIAWTKTPHGGITVDFDTPLKSSKEDFPKVKVEK